ncbi:hypothetical protein [Methanimicrococcus blatticola]|uniref:Uncharacterized protein n=1 Tax=Methanimicrococcus blatticola TaxID=91560 RepID=A0A484F892_9EURY|nr:hypothetical protein [Methanimicrococcus blatticola]MBZ3935221.1 hypothetical protein [Methanimicrococcus blatticola]MCC2508682.1 hypothetical protein [Methanimicrococcus blatticola]TDQ71281.1 hypothetical protein C7391_0388 [Methanimicrococcus blatticola]
MVSSSAKNIFFDILSSNKLDSSSFDRIKLSKSGDKASFELIHFTNPNVPLKLIKPLHLDVIYEEGTKRYIFENKLLKIFSFNEDFGKAAAEFEISFYYLWEEYVLEDESVLTAGAVQLKHLLLEYAEEV